jgi:riboflavin synthase
MFTGIVEELGSVRRRGPHFEFASDLVVDGAQIGDSIAVNGCCLTVTSLGAGSWTAEAVEETLRRTCLGALDVGDRVNFERPVRLQDRLGGHLVQGHVDGVGVLEARVPLADGSCAVRVTAPAEVLRYVVEKGSIAVDGVSLTVAGVDDGGFSVALIPHTLAVTTFGGRRPGDRVNFEVDYLAKVVARMTTTYVSAAGGAR